MLDARAALRPDQYRTFIEWSEDTIASQFLELENTPAGYEDLAGVYTDAPIVAIDQEILWISERVRVERKLLNDFLDMRERVQRLVMLSQYDEADILINSIQGKYGVSFWSVQMRLACLALSGGLERQKQYSAKVRSVYKRGLLNFITYYTSMRNEERTTLRKYMDDVESRIRNHSRYDDAIRTYMRMRLKFEMPEDENDLASIMRVEQSHGAIDIYETFIAVIQEIVRREVGPQRARLIINCLENIDLKDYRISHILDLLGSVQKRNLLKRDSSVSDRLLAGNVKAAYRAAKRSRSDASPDPWSVIYTAFAFSHTPHPMPMGGGNPSLMTTLIARVQQGREVAEDAWTFAAKQALNLIGLPVVAGLYEFLRQIRRESPVQLWQPWIISLNSPFFGPEDRSWSDDIAACSDDAGTTERVWREASAPGGENTYSGRLLRAAGHIQRAQFDSALDELGWPEGLWPRPLHLLRALLGLHALFAGGRRQKVVELIAAAGAQNQSGAGLLPIVASLSELSWPDYEAVESPLAAPIALHLLWGRTEASKTASALRYATSRSLRQLGVSRPSELAETNLAASQAELIYFLRYVCVPEVLDVSRLFSGTRQVLEERQAICSVLVQLDEPSRGDYEAEIIQISNKFALDEGRWIVDSTRIHVDGAAMARWALRELSEDYDRYKDLTKVTVGVAQNFDEVIRELQGMSSNKYNISADTESDAVLISIMKRLADEFLTNSSFGLDFYLSKRVRHQSFIGLIRGPLEFPGLITTRESKSGNYHVNRNWLDRFQTLAPDALDRLDGALRRFSVRFDEVLARAKDSYFHLRSEDKPQGMVVLPLTERQIALARKLIQFEFPFGEFLPVAIAMLWASLEPSLSSIRRLISEEIKSELISEIDIVRAAFREISENDPAFIEFDAGMGKASAEIQVKLDEAAHWFIHADNQDHKRLFSLSQMLDIGVDTALKSQRGYQPVVTKRANGNTNLYASSLVFVHDVLFVGLGNAAKHSGLKTPNIDIYAETSKEDETVTISVTSDCKPANRSENERQADQIRKAIETGTHGLRTRVEEGSGFAKLAAVVMQSSSGKISFGFTPEGRFRLEVTYHAIQEGADG